MSCCDKNQSDGKSVAKIIRWYPDPFVLVSFAEFDAVGGRQGEC